MKVAVAAMSESLDAQVSENFGRCPCFLIVDADTMQFEAVPNAAATAPSGAGPMAAQTVADHNAEIVIAGRLGPKAERALEAAGIRFVAASGTVREALESHRN